MSGKGFVRSSGWNELTQNYRYSALFPPGYPTEIFLLMHLGLDAAYAAKISSWLAWILLLPAVFFAICPIIDQRKAIGVGLLTVLSPALYDSGYVALSDSTSSLFTILSLGFLIRQLNSTKTKWYLISFSGLLAALAFAFRNAAIVLPISILCGYVFLLLTKQTKFQTAAFQILIWGVAFAAVISPILIRNFVLFGEILPYMSHHGLVDFGLVRAFRLVFWSLLYDLSGWQKVAEIAWDFKATIIILFPLSLFLVRSGTKSWEVASIGERNSVIMLSIFVLTGLTMLIWGRSRFDWVETTLIRHVMPYSWVVLSLSFWCLSSNKKSSDAINYYQWNHLFISGFLVVLLVGRVAYIWKSHKVEMSIKHASALDHSFKQISKHFPGVILTNHIKMTLSQDEILKRYVKQLPLDTHIISNFGPIFSLETDRIVRSFDITLENILMLNDMSRNLRGKRIVAILVPTNSMLRDAQITDWQNWVLAKIKSNYQVDIQTPNVIAIRFENI